MKKLKLYFIKLNKCVFIDFKLNIIMTLYMNDVQIINFNKDDIKRIKKNLNVKFYIIDIRLCIYYLDMIIKRNR